MAPNHHPTMDHHTDDEDFIDIEVSSSSSSSSNLFFYTINSPPQTIEFEFQMSCAPSERASTTSPADELFYKGKLLPLHLPPRLQMVQKLLQNTTFDTKKVAFQDESSYPTPFTTTTSTTTTNTPLESCNISPSESCRVSSELNPDEHFFDWSNELSGFISDNNPKRSWSKKLKLIKQSSISQKLKASKAYLKSIFNKSVCSDQSCAKAASTIEEEARHDSMAKEDLLSKYIKAGKKSHFGQTGKGAHYPTLASVMRSTDKEMVEDAVISHRKSFSGAFKRQSATKCCSSSSSSSGASSLSSSFSVNSSGFFELEFFKRSGSANSEIENSIEGAIAHCKQSQQVFSSSKTASEVGLCSLSASRIAEDKER